MTVREKNGKRQRVNATAKQRDIVQEIAGPILAATDGASSSDAALKVGRALARAHGVSLTVLTVLEPVASMYAAMGERTLSIPSVLSDDARSDKQVERVRKQLREVLGDESWVVQTRLGQPARTIAEVADQLGAALIVVGIGRHRPLDRLLSGETALQVIRMATVPVLAVHQEATVPFRRALAAVDFSRSSVRAARAVSSILSPPAQLWLVHVRPPIMVQSEATEGWGVIYAQGVAGAFRRLQQTLDLPPDTQVHPVEMEGNAVDELLAFAQREKIGVIAAGAHGHSVIERMLIGSVATRLVRGASCAVLLTPTVERTAAQTKPRRAARRAAKKS